MTLAMSPQRDRDDFREFFRRLRRSPSQEGLSEHEGEDGTAVWAAEYDEPAGFFDGRQLRPTDRRQPDASDRRLLRLQRETSRAQDCARTLVLEAEADIWYLGHRHP